MTIHREGYPSIALTVIVIAIINFLTHKFASNIQVITVLGYLISAFLLVTILQFFRSPKRKTIPNANHIISPADGKVVVIEEVEEPEYFKGKRLQVSVFMSPINVHINHYPIPGVVKYAKYHPGKYLVAWHPKSSTENERTSIVVQHENNGQEILIRQIAGALARRIVYYSKENKKAVQGGELGFIKFGSRVDLFLPLDTIIKVEIGQKVTGAETVIGEFA